MTLLKPPVAELVDCHTHTVFSDGESTLTENARAALERGVTTLACTDHWGRPSFIDCSMEETHLGSYADEIRATRDAYPSLEIVHGLEADWYPGCAQDIAETKGDATFLLGSVHYLHKKAIDWDEDMGIWDELGADALWRLYVDEWCAAATSGLFDSMAHPDLPRLFSTEGYAPTLNCEPLWDSMAEAARAGGVRIEVNTAGLMKGFGDFYPGSALLERFFDAGVRLTVGSDAHRASRIGDRIMDAYRYIRRIGYTCIDAPTAEGGWRTVSLEAL